MGDQNPKIVKILAVNYKFTNRSVSGTGLAKRAKQYYEQNSRGKLDIQIDVQNVNVPFKMGDRRAIGSGKSQIKNEKTYDIVIHFCNPKSSHAGQGTVITFASYTNTVHELGHAFGLSHANTHYKNSSLGRSRDPFDQMTMFAPYPSTNAVHRWLKGWYLKNEFLDNPEYKQVFQLGQLKNLRDKETLKIIKFDVDDRKYFISHGTYKNKQYITIHTIYGKNNSILLDMLNLEKGEKRFENRSGLVFEIVSLENNIVHVKIDYNENEKLLELNVEDCNCYHQNEDECINCLRIVQDDEEDVFEDVDI